MSCTMDFIGYRFMSMTRGLIVSPKRKFVFSSNSKSIFERLVNKKEK